MSKKYISDSFVKDGGSTFEYLMADGSTSIVVSDGIPSAPLDIVGSGYLTSGGANFVSLSDWFKLKTFYPYLNKQYPEFNDLVDAYDTIPGVQSGVTGNNVDTITFNNLGGVSSAAVKAYSNVRKIIFPDLKYMLNIFTPTVTSGVFDEFVMPNLKFVGSTFTINTSTALTTFNLPSLEVGIFNINNLSLVNFTLPEALELSLTCTSPTAITSLSFPKVKVIRMNFSGATLSGLTTINLPLVEIISLLNFPTTCASLTNFTFGSTLKALNANFITTSNSLNQASVDDILVRLAALDGTAGTYAFSSRTVTITGTSATPSATGLAAKATLILRGCTVTTN